MTDTLKALATALDRLATLEAIVARIDRLESGMLAVESTVLSIDRRVDTLESGDSAEDLEDRIGAILDRKLGHVLEDMLDNALSGREITVTL